MSGHRISALDRLRGLVIALMALDHVRDFFQPAGVSPENWDTTTWPFFLMRWVTHFCAPVFVLLAGVSVGLYLPRRSKTEGLRFLVTRGLWLMLLEPTWISFSWYFNLERTHLGVMWAIGGAMVGLALLLWLPRWAVGVVGAAITLWLSAMPELVSGWELASSASPGQVALHRLVHPGAFEVGGHSVVQSYVMLPWLGVMALGYGLSGTVGGPQRKWAPLVGVVAVLAFLGLRWANGFGDPAPWEAHPRPGTTLMHFLNPTKYPPSLDYQLMTLGPALIALPLLERLSGWGARALEGFGRVPMFFYLLHLPAAHLMGLAYAQLRFGTAGIPGEQPLSLGLILGAWALLLLALFPLCEAWGRFKRANPEKVWLRYL